MSNILVVTGSVRPNSANSKIVPVVKEIIEQKGENVSVADLGELNLPLLNSDVPPSNENFVIKDDNVKVWTEMVDSSDGVVLVMPEYNHTMSPVQLNAIDWVGKEWQNKPVAIVSYGWTAGGGLAAATAVEALSETLKAKVAPVQANLFFMKDVNPDGTLTEESEAKDKISSAIDSLVQSI